MNEKYKSPKAKVIQILILDCESPILKDLDNGDSEHNIQHDFVFEKCRYFLVQIVNG